MKRILVSALLALSPIAFGATLAPVQLLNPVGSSAGQAIVSTGPSSAPGWSNVIASGLVAQAANTVLANATGATASPTAVVMPSCSGTNNALRWTAGTGFTCAIAIASTSSGLNQFAATTSAQLAGVISDETGTGSLVFATNPTLGAATFTGNVVINNSNAQMQVNDTTGTGHSDYYFYNNGSPVWSMRATNTSTFQLVRYVSGTLADTPISISNSNGTMTLADAVVLNGALSGTGFSNYLASPPAIGGTTPAAGTFTTLKGNSLAKVYATNTSAQSIANNAATTVTGWTSVFDANSNFNASTGTFTAPATAYYQVCSQTAYGTMTGGAGVGIATEIFGNGVQLASGYSPYPTTSTFGVVPASVCSLVSLASGQTIVVKAYQNSGGAAALASNANANFLSIAQLP